MVTTVGGPRKGVGKEWLNTISRELCEELVETSPSVVGHDGDDLVLDDRERVSAGAKLAEASLVGYPWVVVIGRDALPSDREQWNSTALLSNRVSNGEACAEVFQRSTQVTTKVPLRAVAKFLREHPDSPVCAEDSIRSAF